MSPTRAEKFKNNTNTRPGVEILYRGVEYYIIAFKIEKCYYFDMENPSKPGFSEPKYF